jgi:cytochrome b561
MHRSLLVRQVLPAALMLVGLLLSAVVVDVLLHAAGWSSVGLWLGPAGTLLIVVSLTYSLRKRKLITQGQPARLLKWHETLSWIGTVAVLVHGGRHFSALLPWLALGAMLVVATSGMIGAVLLKQALATVRAEPAEPDSSRALLDAVTVDLMKRWRTVHMPLNAVFAVLALLHVATALLLRAW